MHAPVLTLVAVAVTIAALAAPTVAVANYDTSRYTYEDSCPNGRSHPIDPINVVFYGGQPTNRPPDESSSASRTLDTIPGWTNGGGSPQSVFTNGTYCAPQNAQNADDTEINDRYHIRLFNNLTRDSYRRWEASGDAHRDHTVQDVNCNIFLIPVHISAGFNYPRNVLARDYRGLRLEHYRPTGNTQKISQCDRSSVGSDGDDLWLRLKTLD